jgi:GT2 family glycosyltransferase
MNQASIVIPVWNGAAVIGECLDAVYAHSGDALGEVICVDNASPDGAAQLIARHYPAVRLLQQPINLGFAGGVNAGLRAARGDVLVLLNQDCVVQAGWLAALLAALREHPTFGIAGCTIFNVDGTLNHAGAQLRRVDAAGVHLTSAIGDRPRAVDYVTGAAMAIRRQTWEMVGPFDDDFYPAYYEEVDYCYRARRAGFEIACVPDAHVRHLFSSREWQVDPIGHWTNQHQNRYRFVCKHYDVDEIQTFCSTESKAVEAETSFELAAARVLAGRRVLRTLPNVLHRRRLDLGEDLSSDQRRAFEVGFVRITHQALATAEKLARSPETPMPDRWRPDTLSVDGQALLQQARQLQERERGILRRVFFLPGADESRPKRAWPRLLRRVWSIATGREYRLLTELNVLHTQRLDVIEQLLLRNPIDRRVNLLETLIDYDYR